VGKKRDRAKAGVPLAVDAKREGTQCHPWDANLIRSAKKKMKTQVGRKEKAIESNSKEENQTRTRQNRKGERTGEKHETKTCGMRTRNAQANAETHTEQASKMEDG
jgi:hypothetical protein